MKTLITNSLLIIVLLISVLSCKEDNSKEVQFNPNIAAFTSGNVSNQSEIMVRFAKKVESATPGGNVEDGIVKITPNVAGKIYWLDEQSLVFKPAERMSSGTKYDVSVDLSKVFEGEKGVFEFDFSTYQQRIRLSLESFVSNSIKGTIMFADAVSFEDAKKMVKATQKGNTLDIEWDEVAVAKEFNFRVNNVKRTESIGSVEVVADGRSVGIENIVKSEIQVPSITDFVINSSSITPAPNQTIEIAFSELIEPNQILDGLIEVKGLSSFTTQIEENVVKVFPNVDMEGKVEVTVYPGIKSVSGVLNRKKELILLYAGTTLPAVEIIGKGNILPESDGLNIPFKAIGLREVQVKIIKIYENNISSFLQENNDIDSRYNLRYAGRPILKKTISLNTNSSLNLNMWNTFSLDLTDLVSFDRGSIYRVEFLFRKHNTVNYASGSSETVDGISENEEAYYSNTDRYYYNEDPSYYSGIWDDRDDPAKDAYYYSNRFPSCSVLASNLGIIAKQEKNGDLFVVVTDLRTTKPIGQAEVEILDLQKQVIKTVKTNKDGIAKIELSRKPFLLFAKYGEERGYMRLTESSALSFSNFNISGKNIPKGLKGFVYGERGVWRPGDTLNVSFILEDRDKTIPKGSPVVFELSNSLGQMVDKQVAAKNESDMYLFKSATDPDDPTGNWIAKFKVGGSVFTQTLRVETVKPNRLKIELDLDSDVIEYSSHAIDGKLNVSWLHGAPAKDLKTSITATLSPMKTAFSGYEDYVFDDPAKNFNAGEYLIYEGKTNSVGAEKIYKAFPRSEDAPGMLRANLRTKVTEKGGDFSVSNQLIKVSPYSVYVGIKVPKGNKRDILFVDRDHKIDVVRVDEDGDLLTESNKLSYVIYKVDWRWWWESSDDNLASYVSADSREVVQSGDVQIQNGKGSINFRVNYPKWGRYLVRVFDKSGHVAGQTMNIDWEDSGVKPGGDNLASASILDISSDKEVYNVKESAQISFPSAAGGRALVTIENGSSVMDEFWVETLQNATTFNIKIEEGMAPNVYVSVNLLQPHAQTKNNLPIRMYGVLPISVEVPETHISPVIDMPKELRPEEEVEIVVSEKNKRAMTYTIAVVEEGLLDLTNFRTPQPHNYFYAKEALGVKTWDMYNSVIGAYGGRIEAVLGIGGDGALSGTVKDVKANRFAPVSMVFGPYELKAGKKNKHNIQMPNYIGSVRTMVVARNDRSYGSVEETVPVKKPLMALATLPRVLGPNEDVKLPVTIFAMDNKIKNVKIKVETNGLVELQSGSTQTISFSKQGDQLVDFDLKVGKRLGIARVKVIAESGKERAEYDIELDVRNPNPPKTISINKGIKPGESVEMPYEMFGAEGSNKVKLEVSSIAPIDFERRLEYLSSYPHSCVEQTTSSVFPLLYADIFCQIDDEQSLENERKIIDAISRMSNYINSDGGFSYWAGQSQNSDWGTSYAGHFLLEAEKKGYNLPFGFRRNWVSYQNSKASSWSASQNNDYLNQAYRLYTLALASSPNNSAMNRMRNMPDLTQSAGYRLAAAYALLGQKKIAEELITRNYSAKSDDYYYSYGSPIRNQAMVLETYALLDKVDQASPIIAEVSKALSSNEWLSTQSVAYAMIALSKWVPTEVDDKLDFEYSVDKYESKVLVDRVMHSIEFPDDLKAQDKVVVTNNSKNTIFARLVLSGDPLEGESDYIARNLDIGVSYTDMDSNDLDVSELEQGTDFIAWVTIVNPGNLGSYEDLAISQIFPSGWEIRNVRMSEIEVKYLASEPKYKDVRDDRVYSYLDLEEGKSVSFFVVLNASYKGEFYCPSVSCEDMYNNQIYARSPGGWVVVK